MTSYTLNIQMSDDTVNKLTNNGYYLFGFKAVESSLPTGQPLIWFKTNQSISQQMSIDWEEHYGAFTSTTDIQSGVQITGTNSYKIELGQTLTVNNVSGTGKVQQGGTSGAIAISNTTSRAFTCGTSQQVGSGDPSPMCAFPLFGENLDVIIPIEKVLLIFATNPYKTSTVIEQSFGPGALVDLTGTTTHDVQYDINNGWGPTDDTSIETIPANATLAPKLIISSPNVVAIADNLRKRLVLHP